jgi:HAD superfamily hydrolase (TIGR01549 family)
MDTTTAVKAVIFDFGQTLVDSADGFRRAEKEAQEKLFAGLALSLREPFLENYRRIRSQFHGRSEFSRRAMWRELYHFYCLPADDAQLTVWESEYWETVKAHSTLFPEAVPVLERLNRRLRVALITNTQGQPRSGTHRISQFPQLEPYFQVVIVAGEEGVPPKPDPEPFRRCLAELGVAAGAAMYVGDDWRIDVGGSRGAGMRPVWLKHEMVQRNWPEVAPDVPVITRLDQLFGLEGLRE